MVVCVCVCYLVQSLPFSSVANFFWLSCGGELFSGCDWCWAEHRNTEYERRITDAHFFQSARHSGQLLMMMMMTLIGFSWILSPEKSFKMVEKIFSGRDKS